MYCQRHRPTPPPGYGGIAFWQNPPGNIGNTENTEHTETQEAALTTNLPVPAVIPPKDEERPPETVLTAKNQTDNGQEPLLGALLREKWTLEDLITVIALLMIVSGQADDGILLVVGLLLLIGGEGSL